MQPTNYRNFFPSHLHLHEPTHFSDNHTLFNHIFMFHGLVLFVLDIQIGNFLPEGTHIRNLVGASGHAKDNWSQDFGILTTRFHCAIRCIHKSATLPQPVTDSLGWVPFIQDPFNVQLATWAAIFFSFGHFFFEALEQNENCFGANKLFHVPSLCHGCLKCKLHNFLWVFFENFSTIKKYIARPLTPWKKYVMILQCHNLIILQTMITAGLMQASRVASKLHHFSDPLWICASGRCCWCAASILYICASSP